MARQMRATDWHGTRICRCGGRAGRAVFSCGEHEFDLGQFAAAARELFFQLSPADAEQRRFLMEMGRYPTAEAGIYVAQVRYVKESRGQK